MMNNSSKFGIGWRQSILAFFIMIILILVASDLAGNNSASQSSSAGGIGSVLAAPQAPRPTATPFQPMPVVQTNRPIYLPILHRESPQTASEVISADMQEVSQVVVEPAPTDTPEVTPEIQVVTPEVTQETQEASPAPQEAAPQDAFVAQEAQLTGDEGRTWEDYPGPSVWPDIEVPAPVGILSHPEDQVNILLLGSDQREGDAGFRTDTIQLLTINPSEGTVKLTSFPRDLYVYIPGYTVQRINTAFGWGGFDALADTMEYNFGVKPEYYVLINFWSFVDVIDSLGGITVEIGRDLCDHRDNWGDFCVSQGTMWMDGKTSLWYVRSRYTSSDLDRGRRQQEVLKAAFNQLIGLNGLTRAPELYDIYKENVTTNLTFELMARFIPLAAHLANTQEIGNHSIGAGQVYDWVNYNGSMVLVPVREPVLEVMRQVISEP